MQTGSTIAIALAITIIIITITAKLHTKILRFWSLSQRGS